MTLPFYRGIVMLNKIKVSKAVSAVFAVLILLSLASCREQEKFLTGVVRTRRQETTDRRNDRVTLYTYVTGEDDSLSYDNNTKFYYPLLQMCNAYNNYCTGMNMGENAVYLVKFPTRDAMVQQMSTEIMSGGGPDLIILDNQLPIRKLMDKGAFEDLNPYIENDSDDKALDINNYDKALLDVGVYRGKRYMMPMLIEPDIYFAQKNLLKDSGLKNTDSLTFKNLRSKLKQFTNTDNLSLFDSYESSRDFLYRYIGDNIDAERGTVSFETKEFKDNIEFMREVLQQSMSNGKYNSVYDDKCLFSKGNFDSEKSMYMVNNYSLRNVYSFLEGPSAQENSTMSDNSASMASLRGNDSSETFVKGLSEKENSGRAYVSCGFMINSNSKFKDKAYAFIRYAMGERMQRFITDDGANFNVPVNRLSLTNMTGFGRDNKEFGRYIKFVKGINTYTVEDGYYNQNVISDLVADYLDGKLSTDNFISNLTSKTLIYLNE